jgi:hypothetical protein
MKMIEQEQAYQGWRNWETWNVALWIENDETLYKKMRSLLPFNKIKAEGFVRRVYPSGTPDMVSEGRKGRFPYYEFVDWQAIADDFNAE